MRVVPLLRPRIDSDLSVSGEMSAMSGSAITRSTKLASVRTSSVLPIETEIIEVFFAALICTRRCASASPRPPGSIGSAVMIAMPAASIRNVRERRPAGRALWIPSMRRELATQLSILFFTTLSPPFW